MKIGFTVIAVFPMEIDWSGVMCCQATHEKSIHISKTTSDLAGILYHPAPSNKRDMGVKDSYNLDNQTAIPSPFNEIVPAFFRAWDNPHAKDDDWINFLSPESLVKFGGYTSQGHDAVRAMRAGFIDPVMGPVVNLEHNLKTYWTLAGGSALGSQAFIIKSSIWYLLVNGRRIDTDCITYVNMADTGNGSWHATEYEVFLASSEIMEAVKALTVNANET